MSLFAGQPALSTPLDPLVSADDFAEWFSLGNGTAASLTDLEQARIQTALEIASAQIRNNRRYFSPVNAEVVSVDAYGGDMLLLPRNRLPITAVTLVEQLIGTVYDTVDATEYTWSPDGYVERYWSWWPCRVQSVRVTYSHGYTVLPRDVAGVCLSLAHRLYTNPDNTAIQSEQLGDHHVTYMGATSGLSSEETLVLSQYESRA